MTKKLKTIITLILLSLNIHAVEKADKVLVLKSTSTLYLMKNKKVLYQYHVSFGANPEGHKHQEGDERTPEGNYTLDYKNPNSKYHKSIHISYPNQQDKKWAKKAGVSAGGDIMIHGQKNGFGLLAWITQLFNWTNGCIAVKDSEMDKIWSLVDKGTAIEIQDK